MTEQAYTGTCPANGCPRDEALGDGPLGDQPYPEDGAHVPHAVTTPQLRAADASWR